MNNRLGRLGLNVLKMFLCIGSLFVPIYTVTNYKPSSWYDYFSGTYSIFNMVFDIDVAEVSGMNIASIIISVLFLGLCGALALLDCGLIVMGGYIKKLSFYSSIALVIACGYIFVWSFVAPATYPYECYTESYGFIVSIVGFIFGFIDFIALKKSNV